MRALETIRYNDGKGTVKSMTHSMFDASGSLIRSLDYSYTYGDPSKGQMPDMLYSMLAGGRVFSFEYDSLGRLTKRTLGTSGHDITEEYEYKANKFNGNLTTPLVETMTDFTGVTHTYKYDENGNIKEESYNGLTNYYYYDSQNRLIRAHDAAAGKVYVYVYDNRGNILAKKTTAGYATPEEWDAAGGEENITMSVQTYTYGDGVWADLLTNIGGAYNIEYDELGNPLNWNSRGSVLTWDVRNLVSYKKGSKTYNFEYNADGLRTKKYTTSGGNVTKSTEYYIVDGKYIGETTTIGTDTYTLSYFYDENGTPAGIIVNGSACYFAKNLQGDVIALVNYQGNVIARYAYNVWGDLVSVTDANGNYISSATHIANLNPFRYRGYMYDEESGFYYLRSRYYDPYIGRFLNADGLVSTGQGLDGHNMFAYCNNNPVKYIDSSGCFPWLAVIVCVVVLAIIAADHYLEANHPDGVQLKPDPKPDDVFDEKIVYADGGGPKVENDELTFVDLEAGIYNGTSEFEHGELSFTRFGTVDAVAKFDADVILDVDLELNLSAYSMMGSFDFDLLGYNFDFEANYYLGCICWEFKTDFKNGEFGFGPPTTGLGYSFDLDIDKLK